MQRIVAVLLVLASAAALAACGDGRLSKSAYIDEMNKIQKPLKDASDSMSSDPKKMATQLPKIKSQLDDVYDQMNKVKPPKEYAAYHKSFLKGVKQMSSAFGNLSTQLTAKTPDAAKLTAVTGEITAAMSTIEKARSDINTHR